MDAISREVLPSDSGEGLPAAVHHTLVVLGVAANQAALAVSQAELLEMQAIADRDGARGLHGLGSHVYDASEMLAECAGRYHEQLVVAYALMASRYAVYAARVAADLVARRPPTTSDVSAILPSYVVTDLDRHLPPLRFASPDGDSIAIDDQNSEIAAARAGLTHVIQEQMFGTPDTDYDSLAVAALPRSQDLDVGLPVALHDYAATVTWAVGVMTGLDQPDAG